MHLLLRLGPLPGRNNTHWWLWVPAFAGTTLKCSARASEWQSPPHNQCWWRSPVFRCY